MNALTTPVYCPQSKQPELKQAAVRIEKAELPWKLLGLAWLDDERELEVRASLGRLMTHFAFAAVVPFGRERQGGAVPGRRSGGAAERIARSDRGAARPEYEEGAALPGRPPRPAPRDPPVGRRSVDAPSKRSC